MIYVGQAPWIASTDIAGNASYVTPLITVMKALRDGLLATGVQAVPCTGEFDFAGNTGSGIVVNGDSPYNRVALKGFFVVKLETTSFPTIYLRFDFGARVGSQSSNIPFVPYFGLKMGTSVSATGVLTGLSNHNPITTSMGCAINATGETWGASLLDRKFYISSDGQNYLTMVMDPLMMYSASVSATLPFWLAIERSINPSTGQYDGDGAFFVTGIHDRINSSGAFGAIDLLSGNVQSINAIPAQCPGLWPSTVSGGATQVFPITCCLPKPKAPMKACVFYYASDINTGLRFNTNMLGETVTYIACGLNANSNATTSVGLSYINPTYVAPALRFT